MNLRETKQLLTMLWSMYPNAPKLSKEDKEIMAMAWLTCLYEYSLEDVWKAVKKCVEREPRFIPTAPEVQKRTEKDYKVEKYLTQEYEDLNRLIDRSITTEIGRERRLREFKVRIENKKELTEEEKEIFEKDKIDSEISKRIDKLWNEAYEEARIAYEQRERAKLADDGMMTELKRLAIV